MDGQVFTPVKFMCDCVQIRNESQWKDDLGNWIKHISLNGNQISLLGCEIYTNNCGILTIQHLFAIVKKLINLLRNQVLIKRDLSRTSKKYNWDFVREQILTFLWCVDQFGKHKSQSGQVSEVAQLWIEIKQLLVFLGRLCNISESVYYELATVVTNDTPACHLFHLNAEIWFNCLNLFDSHRSNIQPNEAGQLLRNAQLTGDLMIQTANILLADQIILAANKFKNEFAGQSIKFINPFTCECIKIILMRIRKLLEKNDLFSHSDCENEIHPFWVNCNRILDQIMGIAKTNDGSESIRYFQLTNCVVDMSAEDQNLCRLWIIANLSIIFNYDENYIRNDCVQASTMQHSQTLMVDNYESEVKTSQVHNLPYTIKLVQLIVKNEDSKEEANLNRIMIAMRLCYNFVQYWPVSVELILPFLDFFVKRLNVSLGPNNVENIRILPKNGFNWAQQIRQKSHFLAQGEYVGEMPLSLFFGLIYELISRIQKQSIQMQFQKFKGRLYSKLQPKKLEELKEIGLFNLMSLFLTLVYGSGCGWIDLIDKFGDLVRHSKQRHLHQTRSSLMIKATFAFLHLLPKDSDASKLTNLLSGLFNDLSELLPNWVPDNLQLSTAHNVCASLIAQYCDELSVFWDAPEYKNHMPTYLPQAYGVRFDCVVHKLNDRETSHMLHFVLSTVKHLHILVDVDLEECLDTCTLLFQHIHTNFMSFVRTEFVNRSAVNHTPDIAFHFTYLNLMLSSNENDFRTCINQFAFNKHASINNVCRYLYFLLDNQHTCQKLSELHPAGLDHVLLEHWMRIVICTQQPNSQLNKLTLELSKHVAILNGAQTDAVGAFELYCERIRAEFDQLSSFEKSKVLTERNRILMEMVNEAKIRIKDEKLTEDLLQHMYNVCSTLVAHCAPLLYTSGNSNTVVPVLLETLFNPTFIHNLSSNRQMQVNGALRKHLAVFLNGIELLLDASDPYLERKMRQMLAHFIPTLASKTTKHPIVVAVANNAHVNVRLMRLLKSQIVNDFLDRGTNASTSFQMIQFMSDLYQMHRNEPAVVQWYLDFVPYLLQKIMVCEEIVKRRIRDMLQMYIGEQMHADTGNQFADKLYAHVEKFIKHNKQTLNRAIKVMDLTMPLCPNIKDRVIALLLNQIQEVEKTKFGSDDTLRSLFQQFVNNHS